LRIQQSSSVTNKQLEKQLSFCGKSFVNIGEVMVEVLLSDIDGTLVDSNALHAEAWRRTFEHFGIQVGMDQA
jgi:hypothetical protein